MEAADEYSWLIIGTLLVVGLALLAVEVILIPGTTVVGIIGVIAMMVGVYMAYGVSNEAGHLTLGGALIACIIFAIIGYKAFTSQKFSVRQVLEGKTNVREVEVLVGDRGKAVANLRPAGMAKIHDKKLEVTTLGEFVETGSEIEVIKTENNKIFVKPVNTA